MMLASGDCAVRPIGVASLQVHLDRPTLRGASWPNTTPSPKSFPPHAGTS